MHWYLDRVRLLTGENPNALKAFGSNLVAFLQLRFLFSGPDPGAGVKGVVKVKRLIYHP